jgi:putative 4-mercaptohistidine N1-methyltranferase
VSGCGAQYYESGELLEQYMAFHYADEGSYCPWPDAPASALGFARRVAEWALRISGVKAGGGARALDLGCSVGRTALELSREFDEVLGVDLSENFVRHAEGVARGEVSEFEVTEEGERRGSFKILRSGFWREDCVRFRVGDACNLEPWPGKFELVVMANLLCRTPDPQAVLVQMPRLVVAGGLILITTPCSWSEQFTPRGKWLCGESGRTLDGIGGCLGGCFELCDVQNMPFLIREHARKFQWSVAEASVWRRL